MDITAKVVCNHKSEPSDGQVSVGFTADYNDGRNKEWAKYTPALGLSMTVLESVPFELGKAYTLTFTPED